MNCKKALSWLSAYQDGELSGQRILDLENHLKNCADCHDELAVMQKLFACLSSHASLPPIPGFSSSIMAGLRVQPENKFRLLPSLAYTLALLMIFISGFLLELSSNNQPPTAPQLTTTFSAILAESRDLGLQDVQESSLDFLEPYNKFSAFLAQKICYPRLLSSSSGLSGNNHEK